MILLATAVELFRKISF